jgi:hypothetical protein
MRRSAAGNVLIWVAAVLVVICPGFSSAELVFRPSAPPTGNKLVINAAEQSNPRDWPATFYMESETKICTSTVVGPRVIITAAHCITADPSSKGTPGTVESGSDSINVHCLRDPAYSANSSLKSQDIAVCTVDSDEHRDIPIPYGGGYERVSFNSTLLAPRQAVRLIGYGCRMLLGGGPEGELWDGVSYRQADSSSTGSGAIELRRGAAACFGDSGGATYLETDSLRRLIVGVVVKSDLIDQTYLAPIGPDKKNGFFNEKTADLLVCGRDPTVNPRCHP